MHCAVTSVVELSAVVGGREDGHQLAPREELVAVLHHLNDTHTHTHTFTGEQAAEGCGWSRAGAHLVRSANEVQVMSAQELSHHVLSEGERHPCTTHRGQGWMLREDRSGQVSTSVVLAPAHDVLVRVRPQQVAQQTRVGYVYTHTHTYIPISIQTHTHTYTMRLIFNECLMGGPGTRIIVIAITQP